MKSIKVLIGVLVLIGLFSFKNKQKLNVKLVTGTYGVCNGNNILSLKLKDDSTFQFTDNTNPNNKLSISGNWELNNNTIVLKNTVSETNFHNKWKFDFKYNCIKSRKELLFIDYVMTKNTSKYYLNL
jgi:hypothetical protein